MDFIEAMVIYRSLFPKVLFCLFVCLFVGNPKIRNVGNHPDWFQKLQTHMAKAE